MNETRSGGGASPNRSSRSSSIVGLYLSVLMVKDYDKTIKKFRKGNLVGVNKSSKIAVLQETINSLAKASQHVENGSLHHCAAC